jgi:hypothetical protein
MIDVPIISSAVYPKMRSAPALQLVMILFKFFPMIAVKGRYEQSFSPEPLQKWKSRPLDPRWCDPSLPDVRSDMPAPRQ